MHPSPSRSRRSLRLRRALFGALASLLVIALVAGLLAVWSVRRPFPTHDGELPLAALDAPVTVHRDDHGVPHLYADTAEDLFRAQGFVHAQDRFWEMDFRRHVTSGRLAELFGPDQVDTDAFLRTLGWRRVAEAEWELLGPDARRYLTAYAEGVNAWLDATGGPAATGRKALQYRVLGLQRSGYRVAEWDPVDSLAWLKAMAWDLRGNMQHETTRAALLAHGLTRDEVAQLYPEHPYETQPPVVDGGEVTDGVFTPPDGSTASDPPATGGTGGTGGAATAGRTSLTDALSHAAPVLTALRARVADLPRALGTGSATGGLGSNAWVLGGAHTTSGEPLLVNDPHLGPSMPGLWHQVGLHCTCDYDVTGFGFSGVPGVVIGHNGQIAWGFTNVNPDVSDLYLERIHGDRYLVDGEWRDLDVREETIGVAGDEDVTLTVRETHRGPLLSDADDALHTAAVSGHAPAGDEDVPRADPPSDIDENDYGVSLAWTALTPGTTVEALFALNQAQDFDEFRAAAALFEVPAQNLVYADVEGTIGYQMPGVVPVRGDGAHGRWLAPGWVSDHDWVDTVSFAALPYVQEPSDGRIVTANQPVVGPQYDPLLTTDWGQGYRSNRIHTLLDDAVAQGPVDRADMARILFDHHNPLADELVPALRTAAAGQPLATTEREALDLLRDWDHQQPADGAPGTARAHSAAAAAYFNAVWRHLLRLTFDELPDDQPPDGGGRWFTVVTGLLDAPRSPWWDRVGTATTETRDDILRRALSDAYRELAAEYGHTPAQWRWGDLHTLTLRDESFGTSGIAPVEALFNRGPVPVAGGTDIVNATSWDAGTPGYDTTVVPSMRMIVDLSSLDDSRWIQLTGNSGHAYHPHYDDQLDLWRTGDMLPWRWSRDAVTAATTATLTLSP